MTSHNPDNLPDEVIGVADGWRLLNKDEIQNKRTLEHISIWSRNNQDWEKHCAGSARNFTYRTRLSPQVLASLRSGYSLPTSPCHPGAKATTTYVLVPTWGLVLMTLGSLAAIGILLFLLTHLKDLQ